MLFENRQHPVFVSFSTVLWLITTGLLIFAGCVSTPVTRYYSLTPVETHALFPVATDSEQQISSAAPLLGIGPLHLAKYLDRTQIAVRPTAHRIELSEFDQWASDPEDQIYLAVQENLSALMATDHMVRYPWKRSMEPDFQIIIDIIQMDGIPGEMVQLIARWQLYQRGEADAAASRKTDITEPVSKAGFAPFAQAHSRALGRLCRAIAQEITMARQKANQ